MEGILYFFDLPYISLFYLSLACLAGSLVLFQKEKEMPALTLLFLSALFVRLFVAYQDPFLNTWDERYHALVARNLMNDPLLPFLRNNPIASADNFSWTNSHVWVHKQPLFMWQIALSMKVFGVSEFSLRYPSVLMGALMVLLTYSIAKNLTGNKKTALFAALIVSFSEYQLEMISGERGMEHNDVAFHFYVLASIWAYCRYTTAKTMKNILLIGVFAGCAILNKWLTGLLVFAGWGMNILLLTPSSERMKEIKNMLLAMGACVVIFAPWQFYILHAFPFEANQEYSYNAKHISEVVEGHYGSNFHYIDNFPFYFGEVGWAFIPIGLVVLFLYVRRGIVQNRLAGSAMITIFMVVFVFFSYIVKTKITSYFFVMLPVAAICLAIAVAEIKQQMTNKGWLKAGMVLATIIQIATIISILNPEAIKTVHDPNKPERLADIRRAKIYKQLKDKIPANVKVVINANTLDDITAMFYNNDLTIYAGMIPEKILDSLTAAHAPFAAFASRPSYEFPEYMNKYPTMYIIRENIE